MKKNLFLLILLFSVAKSKAQNVGIGTPGPTTTLDLKGGFRIQPKLIPLTASIITIPDNESNVLLQAGYAGDFSVTITTAQPGQRLIIDNQTGYIGAIEQDELIEKGMNEYIYSLGKWKIANKDMSSWKLTGNAGTSVSNYMGTSDAQPIRFRTHGNRNVGLLDNVRTNYHIGGGLPNAASYIGVNNVSLGYLSSTNLQAGSYNVSLGFYSLFSNKSGDDNVAIGTWAMRFNKTGAGNVAIGQYASAFDTSANGNIAIGSQAMQFNQSRNGNTAIGTAALQYNTNNGSIGSKEGEINTAIGAYALNKNLRGSGAVAIGAYAAFSDTAAEGIVAIGRGALFHNKNKKGNVAIGDSALFNNTNSNAIGPLASVENTAIGFKALKGNISGNSNVGIGNQALELNEIGAGNTAVGSFALGRAMSSSNTAVGYYALYQNQFGENTAIGASALESNQSGGGNVAFGIAALQTNVSGSNNVALGRLAGVDELGSNKLYIENSSANKNNSLIYGDFAADSLLLNAKTVVRNNAVVQGFTKLGGYAADVPSIKMKKFTGISSSSQNGFTDITHGLTRGKIIGVQVIMKLPGFVDLGPGSRVNAGYEYEFQILDSIIRIANLNGNSANILSKNFVVLVTYEE